MCIIIVKPKGVKMPATSQLRRLALFNSDGCGFVSDGDYYRSLNFEEFMRRLRKVKTSEQCIIHFRFATHGSVCVANCHPFKDEETGTYFAHNGVFDFIKPCGDETDSECLFRTNVMLCLHEFGWGSDTFNAIMDSFCQSSRVAMLHNEEIKTWGRWYSHNGCLYSKPIFR